MRKNKKTRIIDGITFYLYRVSRNKTIATNIAKKIRKKGYYVRVFRTSRGYEIWVSANPRWFYKFEII